MSAEAQRAASAGATPAVSIVGLTRRFGHRWALRGVDLEVAAGASVALIGHNGAGKTTLLRVLATSLRPTAGEARVFQMSVRVEDDSIRRRCAMMTPNGFLYDELTGAENLRFAARMSGGSADRDQLSATLREVGLEDAGNLPVRGYSSGMRKRLELGRLLVRAPDLLLLDEPFVSLDADGVRLVMDAVRSFRERGATVIFATHQRAEAEIMADSIARLEAGRVVAVRPAEPV